MSQSRNERLAADYRGMLAIQDRPYLSWIATKGELPYAEEYLLTVRVRTYVFSQKGRACTVGAIRQCTIRLTLWDSYPHMAPHVKMLSIPPVFHPDWFSKGAYCPPVPWREEDSLKDYVIRMIRTLQYDPSLIETASPANYKALDWYMKNRDNTALFPCDTTPLTENSPDERAAAEQAAAAMGEIVDSWIAGQ